MISKGLKRLLDEHKPTPGWLYGLVRAERAKQARQRRPDIPFSLGQKQVFLPNFTITLLRTPSLSPRWAQFIVPLSLNKLDLRDYLYHAYSVHTLSIRSFIKQSPIVSVQRGSARDLPGKRKQYRPRASKKMTVELAAPFAWPEAPRNLEKWDGDRFRKLQKMAEAQQARGEGERVAQAKGIAEVAQRLLEGKLRWKGESGGGSGVLTGGAERDGRVPVEVLPPGVMDVRGEARP